MHCTVYTVHVVSHNTCIIQYMYMCICTCTCCTEVHTHCGNYKHILSLFTNITCYSVTFNIVLHINIQYLFTGWTISRDSLLVLGSNSTCVYLVLRVFILGHIQVIFISYMYNSTCI